MFQFRYSRTRKCGRDLQQTNKHKFIRADVAANCISQIDRKTPLPLDFDDDNDDVSCVMCALPSSNSRASESRSLTSKGKSSRKTCFSLTHRFHVHFLLESEEEITR